MKKALLTIAAVPSLGAAVALAAPVTDWHDLDAVHSQVQEAIREMAAARAKNHYDMDGHGAKAEELLRHAERELREAVASAKRAR